MEPAMDVAEVLAKPISRDLLGSSIPGPGLAYVRAPTVRRG